MCSENMPDKQVGKLRCSIGLAARYEVYHLCSRTGACLRSDAVSDGWDDRCGAMSDQPVRELLTGAISRVVTAPGFPFYLHESGL